MAKVSIAPKLYEAKYFFLSCTFQILIFGFLNSVLPAISGQCIQWEWCKAILVFPHFQVKVSNCIWKGRERGQVSVRFSLFLEDGHCMAPVVYSLPRFLYLFTCFCCYSSSLFFLESLSHTNNILSVFIQLSLTAALFIHYLWVPKPHRPEISGYYHIITMTLIFIMSSQIYGYHFQIYHILSVFQSLGYYDAI